MRISPSKTLFVTWMVLAAFPRPARADSAGEAYAVAQSSYRSLRAASEERRRFRHTWQDSIDKFKAVTEKYPKSSVADDALFTMGKLYLELYDVSRLNSDLELAVKNFRACEERFPASNYSDDSLFWEAKALHLMNRHTQEIAALRKVIEKFPEGDMRNDSMRALAKLESAGEAPKGTVALIATPAVTASPALGRVSATPSATPVAVEAERTGGEALAEAQEVTGVKPTSSDTYTRVAIYTGGSVHYTVNELKADGDKPPRVYLDLTRAKVGEALRTGAAHLENSWEIPIGDGLLQRVRVSQNDPETVRVVLDVASMESYQIVQLDDPFRILVDVSASKDASAKALAAAATPAQTPAASPTPTLTPAQLAARIKTAKARSGGLTFAEQLGLKAGKIYVDAGHGGGDPGATGPKGLPEKDVTLAIAKKLQSRLIALGYDAVLTRSDNTFLELEERTAIANAGKGDLFVSIHCNSTDPKSKNFASGVETYYANLPSDAASARLAAVENKTTQEKMSGLTAVLETLTRNEFTDYSVELAAMVQRQLAGDVHKVNIQSKDYGVKSALFYVLLTARMPAILVETSFISNEKDEAKLKDAKYQQTIADAVAKGVDDFIESRAAKPVMQIAAPTPRATQTPTPFAGNKKDP